MKLGFRLLDDVFSCNYYREVEELTISRGDVGFLYFQLVSVRDICKTETLLRHIPEAGATVMVKVKHIDTNREISRPANQVFPLDDRSIWRVEIRADDVIGPDALTVILTEGGVQRVLQLVGSLRSAESGYEAFFC
jgi:hypothetical protein